MEGPSARRSRAWPWFAAATLLLLPSLWIFNRTVPPPAGLGLQDGRLAPCPDSPNCVGSESADGAHRIEPLRWAGSPEAAMARLLGILRTMRGARVITATPNYLHVEFRTLLCQFVDDVEFRVAPSEGVLHVRSASRVGHSDLGTNRRRIGEIRQRFTDASPSPSPPPRPSPADPQ